MPTPTLRVAATDVLCDTAPQDIDATRDYGTGTLGSRCDHTHRCNQFTGAPPEDGEPEGYVAIPMPMQAINGAAWHYNFGPSVLLDVLGARALAACMGPKGYNYMRVHVLYYSTADKELAVYLRDTKPGAAPTWNRINGALRTFTSSGGNQGHHVLDGFTYSLDSTVFHCIALDLASQDTTAIYIHSITCLFWQFAA